jgi:L-fucose isomerase-like protein
MNTKLRTIFALPSGSWGGLFTQEEREREIEKFKSKLNEVKPLLPNVEFIEEELRNGEDFAKLDEEKGEDGLLLFSLSGGTDQAIFKAMDRGLPMVLFVEPYSWHVWCREALKTHENAHNLMLLSSTDFGEVVEKVKVIDAYKRLKETKILLFQERRGDEVKLIYGADSIPRYSISDMEGKFGVNIEKVDKKLILDAYEEVEDEKAEAVTANLLREAEWTVEPSRDEIFKASKLYLAIKRVIEEAEANAITIDCLAMLRDLPTTPCVGFSKLNDEGICAACEADLNSLLTMLVFKYLGDVPSFITDPVIDTARNSVIHAHCVSATKMDGKNRERFIIRNHSESRTGVALQVKMKEGQEVTVAKFASLSRMLVSTGTIIGNPDVDRGCRTKVEVLIEDAKKLLRTFSGGLHRVLAYGDYVEPLEDLCRLLDIEVVSE